MVFAHLSEKPAADGGPGVAFDATELDELGEAAFFLGVHGTLVAGKHAVKTSGGDEGALEGRDGLGQIIVSHRITVAGKGAAEGLRITLFMPQLLHDFLRVPDGHFDQVQDGALGLAGEIAGAAIPELPELKAGVNDRGGIPGTEDAGSAFGSGSNVGAGAWGSGEQMTILTSLGLVVGDATLKKEPFAQGDALRGVGFAAGHGRGQGAEKDASAQKSLVPAHEGFRGMALGARRRLNSFAGLTADRGRIDTERDQESQTDGAGQEAVFHSRTPVAGGEPYSHGNPMKVSGLLAPQKFGSPFFPPRPGERREKGDSFILQSK